MTWLAAGNVLAALLLRTHVHHERAHRWFVGLKKDRFATCPVTQGTLLRVHMRLSVEGSAAAAWEALRAVSAHPLHEWWDGPLDYLDVPHRNLQGHKQVTDAWLAELAPPSRRLRRDARFRLRHPATPTRRCCFPDCCSRCCPSPGYVPPSPRR